MAFTPSADYTLAALTLGHHIAGAGTRTGRSSGFSGPTTNCAWGANCEIHSPVSRPTHSARTTGLTAREDASPSLVVPCAGFAPGLCKPGNAARLQCQGEPEHWLAGAAPPDATTSVRPRQCCPERCDRELPSRRRFGPAPVASAAVGCQPGKLHKVLGSEPDLLE